MQKDCDNFDIKGMFTFHILYHHFEGTIPMLHVIILRSAASQFLTSVDILIFLHAGQQLLCRMVVGFVHGKSRGFYQGAASRPSPGPTNTPITGTPQHKQAFEKCRGRGGGGRVSQPL